MPSDADAKYNLGFVYLQQSKADEAATLFQQVLSAHPDDANAQYQIGKILMDRGDLSDAVEHLETATRLSPQTDYMHYQLQAATARNHAPQMQTANSQFTRNSRPGNASGPLLHRSRVREAIF